MKKKNGFTLVDFLAVVIIAGIISLIAAILVVKFINKDSNNHYSDYETSIIDSSNNRNNNSSSNSTYVKDTTPPVCGKVSSNINDWTKDNETISVECSDTFPGCERSSFQKTFTKNDSDYTVTIYDLDSNSTVCDVSGYVHFDKINPTCSITISENYNSKKAVMEVNDNLSGVASYGINKTNSETFNTRKEMTLDYGENHIYGFVKDKAGNIGTCSIDYYYNDQYKISYNDNGGSGCSQITQNVKYKKQIGSLCTPTRVGYTFDGWYLDNSFKTKISNNSSYSYSTDTTLIAKWIKGTYKIFFNSNGGNGSSYSITCNYDEDCTLPLNKFSYSGKVFDGWSLNNNGVKTYNDGAVVRNLASSNGTVNLYALWKVNSYTITFMGNRSTSGDMATIVANYGDTITLPTNTYKRLNYGFIGWSLVIDGDVVYNNKDKITVKSDLILYAKWGSQYAEYLHRNTPYTFTAKYSGFYKVELYGAQGGSGYKNGNLVSGGDGGYISGIIYINKGQTYYFYVGSKGGTPQKNSYKGGLGGYNGGGVGGSDSSDKNDKKDTGGTDPAGGGGGAADMRLKNGSWDNQTSLNSRILVAGGGGGGSYNHVGGNGCEYVNNTYAKTYGMGQNGHKYHAGSGAGGGGYYGGNSENKSGGKGYGGMCYASQSFTNVEIYQKANKGDARAKITFLGVE